MFRIAAPLAVFVLTAMPLAVFAHAVGVSCTMRGKLVEVEAYYDDDTPAIKAKISVLDAQEKVIASGVSDEKGRWSFAAPGPGRYEVLLDAGAGHRARTTLLAPGAASQSPPAEEQSLIPPGPRSFASAWANLLIGLAVIAGGCAIVMFVARWRSKSRASRERQQPELERQRPELKRQI